MSPAESIADRISATSLREQALQAISDICGELDEAFSGIGSRRRFVLPHGGCFASGGSGDTGSCDGEANRGGYFFLSAPGHRPFLPTHQDDIS
ncbi:hypothetical protein [Bradyrhizobium macuxiense]|uniref:hypothetical protein n=1 Tax=Bradyrhizobium macuxiense TaxID=1755647 RepID=UPI0011BFC2CA|nr:hypothetical protein [Bradyrhizobium macuxiense]